MHMRSLALDTKSNSHTINKTTCTFNQPDLLEVNFEEAITISIAIVLTTRHASVNFLLLLHVERMTA